MRASLCFALLGSIIGILDQTCHREIELLSNLSLCEDATRVGWTPVARLIKGQQMR